MENGKTPAKKRFKINIFDIVIIAAVLVVAAILIVVMFKPDETGAIISSGDNVTVRYTIELSNMTPEAAAMVAEGDTLKDNIKKYAIGAVKSVTVGPTYYSTKNYETGEYIISESPEYKTATIVIEASAIETDTAVTVDSGYIIRIGLPISVSGPGYAGTGYIIDVERSDDAE